MTQKQYSRGKGF